MKILTIIPARSGSKGVKGKNIRVLGDLPLLAYSICAAKQSELISKVIVSTDSQDYAEVSKKFGAEVPFLRPESLAKDTTASIDVIIHALDFLSTQGETFDAVCILQPTSPFRSRGLIDTAIKKMIRDESDALVSVLPVPHEFNPHWTYQLDGNNMLKISTGENKVIQRRQDLPPAYFRDGSIYLTKVDVLLSQRSLYGERLSYIVSDPALYVNIDREVDWLTAEEKLKHVIHLIHKC